MEMVGHGIRIEFAEPPLLRANDAGEVAEMIDGQW